MLASGCAGEQVDRPVLAEQVAPARSRTNARGANSRLVVATPPSASLRDDLLDLEAAAVANRRRGASSTVTSTSRWFSSPWPQLGDRRRDGRARAPRAARWLSLTAARLSGSPGLSCSSRSIVSALVRTLPTISTWSTKTRGPSCTVNTTSAVARSALSSGCARRSRSDSRDSRSLQLIASRSAASRDRSNGAPGCSRSPRRSCGLAERAVAREGHRRRPSLRALSVTTIRTVTGTSLCRDGVGGIDGGRLRLRGGKAAAAIRSSIAATSASSFALENGSPSRIAAPAANSASGTSALPAISTSATRYCGRGARRT